VTHILSNPDTFVDDALEGFARTHADVVRRVDGGVVRAEPLPAGYCAVVVGGGSGHYPAFAGVVGEGLAAGAVCGEVFTSPSAGAAERVARAAHAGGGVLFSYGNYAGDVIHFGAAERRLREDGIDCRTVLVTDDVASAPVTRRAERRGIAGDFVVFKVAGALAARGASIDEVERVARWANERTVTMGVAFGGCSLPGADAPLFTVPDGTMSMGLGIHGEPGVRDETIPQVERLARGLLEPLLIEKPAECDGRVGLVVNGLGAVKYEELFVLLRHVWDQLEEAGLDVVISECGELVTSLDMAGASVTLTWLDDELEDLWRAPAATPAYRRGAVEAPRPAAAQARGAMQAREARETMRTQRHVGDHAMGNASSQPSSAPLVELTERQLTTNATLLSLLERSRTTIEGERDALGALDAIAGDGDHGTGMARGLGAAVAFTRANLESLSPRHLLAGAGEAWSETAGGTSGALWGAALTAIADELAGWDGSTAACARAARNALDAVRSMGGADVGDKTMVDAMAPFAHALAQAHGPLADALATAAAQATRAAAATAQLEPKRGRARPLAARSLGHPDPGATSFALIVSALAERVEVTQ
jgi:dihydroxyacetone kinase